MNIGAIVGLILGFGVLGSAAITGSASTGGLGSLWDLTSL